ncbi:hypothetical protein [Chlamydia sp. 17-3921]|uniref:tetratricopeptide repeat protein n=1 Tax=Chlamydia sp. 17-3921 TaxID=2675798 RepID=UPI0019180558|nr:hypothetical protein [Chlamydia sp. 17-3921]
MKLSTPFISFRKSIFLEESDYDQDYLGFLISELEFLVSQGDASESFLALAETILMLTHDHPVFLKKIIFYGMTWGMKYKDPKVFTDVLTYIDILFPKLGISTSDRLSLCSARVCIHFEMFILSGNIDYIMKVLENANLIKQLLELHSQLENSLGWEHFRLGINREEISFIASANVYHIIGKSFIILYQRYLELDDLTYGIQNLSRSVDLSPNNLKMREDYAEALICAGVRKGKSLYIELGMEQLSRVIFLSFGRIEDEGDQENYRFRYALAAVQLFDVSYKKEHFQQAIQILYQTIQAFPHLIYLWEIWGELLIRFGWINNNMRFIESGLEKLASVQKKSRDPISLSGSLAAGISILGLYLEEPGLFRESRQRLITVMKAFPGNHTLVYALGVIQLCSALYFDDDTNFASAISCFQSCLEWDHNSLGSLQKLFDAYFSWGVKKKNPKLLHKAVDVASRLCDLRPEVFLFWSDRGLALKCLAEASSDVVYKEIFLMESLLHYQKAWELSFRVEILELWGHSYYLLGELQENLTYYNEAYNLLSKIDPSVSSFKVKLILAATLLGKGSLLQEESFFKEAEAILKILRQAYPEDENVLLLSGKVYLFLFWKKNTLSLGKQAKFYLEQAISLGCPEAFYVLGKLYAVEKDVERAWKMVVSSICHGVVITEAQWLKDPYLANLRAIHTFHEILADQRGGLWLGS